jgi:hypothetical protein
VTDNLQAPPAGSSATELQTTAGDRRPYIVTLAVVAACFGIFWYNAAPSVTFHDSGEFALAATCAGLAHPPGAPTWTLLATAFVKLLGFADAARGTNLFTAFLGSITQGLLYLFAYRCLTLVAAGLSFSVRTMAALVAPLAMLHSEAFLEQCFATEQYTLLTTLLLWFLLLLLYLEKCSVAKMRVRWRLYYLLGLVAGLALGNHPSQLCLLFPLGLHAALLYARKYTIADIGRRGVANIAGFLTGALVYLWLPLRALRPAVLDWVRASTFDRFWWAITRQLWPRRTIAEAPEHFVSEWLLTYDLIGELGFVAFALALAGLVVFLIRFRRLSAFWYFPLIVGIYAFGMFWGHLTQESITMVYLRHYGVRDWHLPIYILAAWCAALAVAALCQFLVVRSGSKAGFLVALTAPVLLGVLSVPAVQAASLRNFKAPENFIRDRMAVLPEDAIAVIGEDNASNMLAYTTCGAGSHALPQRIYYGYLVSLEGNRAKAVAQTMSMPDFRVWYVDGIQNPRQQPLYHPPLSKEDIRRRPLFVDYVRPGSPVAKNLLPAGFLFRITDTPTTPGQIMEAELQWRKQHPEALRTPPEHPHHLEMEARGMGHWQRADYFHEREMWALALEEYKRSLQWLPLNGVSWFGLGMCLEKMNAAPEQAIQAYETAIRTQPWLRNVRLNLGVLLVEKGNLARAEELFAEEVRINPENNAARVNLDFVRKQLTKQGT